MQLGMVLRDIANICSIDYDDMYQGSVSNYTNIRLHTKVPLVACLDLVHL